MKKTILLLLTIFLSLQGNSQTHTFKIADGNFLLDGKPFQIISGEMHFARIPSEYWRDRLKMAKAMGLNTIATYVFWNYHEPEKGEYNFKGNADVARFVKIAQEEGLWVIIRPSPYACAEWEFGGYPYWLMKEDTLKVRSRDPRFLEMSWRYMKALAKELSVPVLALSQLSRAVEQRDDKRPQLSDLRESGSIEQDADVVMFVYRPEYYLEKSEPQAGTAEHITWQEKMSQVHNQALVIIGKQRHGPTGIINLEFESAYTKFKDANNIKFDN